MSKEGTPGKKLAAFLSFFIPGLGQLLQGRPLRAFLHFVLACLLWFVIFWLGWVVHLWSAMDAATYGIEEGK